MNAQLALQEPDAAAFTAVPPGMVQAVYLPAANDDACYAEVAAGKTIAEILGEDAAYSIRVTIGGFEVPRAVWDRVRPKPGQRVHVEFWPQGGPARKWILTIVAIVATVFSMGAAAGASWALIGGLSATTVMVGGAVIAALALALIPPPMPKMPGQVGSDPGSQLQSLTGTQNQANPYGVIPLVIGDTVMFPPHAAMPYTEIVGNDQYMRIMLDLGKGDLDVSDITLLGKPLSGYEDVEYEITTTPTLFTQDVNELQVGTPLKNSGDSDTRTTQQATTEISADLVFPQGLYGINNKGKTVTGKVAFTVLYRANGDTGSWSNATAADGLTLSGNWSVDAGQLQAVNSERGAVRLGVRWKVPSGQYDVRVVRGSASFTGAMTDSTSGDAAWAVLRSISPEDPSKTGTTKLVVRIRATDQLQGVVSQLSARVAQKIRRWDADTETWMTPVATRNPAWIYHWLMTECPGTVVHASDDQMDIDTIATWAADCDAKGLTYSGTCDSARRFGDLVKDVLACGLATFGMRGGKYSVVRDTPQTVPMQVYTPINRGSINWTRNFTPPPHALRVTFTNPEQDYQQDERVVYWNGYDESNATRIEKLDLRNVTGPDAAWKIARYHLAVMWLRPVTYQMTTDFEHLVNERGDLIEAAGPLIGWGVAYGRVRSVGGNGTTVVLAEPLAVEAGKSYAIRTRLATAFSATSNITVDSEDPTKITLATPNADIKAGQVYVVGEVGKVSAPMLITGIESQGSMLERKATLTLVDAAPDVWTAADGTPPPFVSSINGTPWCAPPPPPVVHIRTGNTAPDDAGVIRPQPGLTSPPGGGIFRGVGIYGVSRPAA